LDARSDLFSLGVVLYELLAGRHPFSEQDGDATIARIAHGKPTPLSETAYRVPAGLAVVVERLLKNDPDERFESALAFAETLDKFAPSHGVYRKVGQLARAARPPETLLPADKTGSPAMLQAVHQEAFTEEIPSSISDDSGSAVAANRLAQLEPIPADPKQSTESVSQRLSSPAPYSGEMPMQSRSVALFGRKLLLLIMAALAVISVSAVFLAITKDSKAVESENIATSNPAASPHPDPSPRPAKEPVGLSDYKKANTNILRSEIESNRANTSREESVVPRPETASTSNVKVRNATKKRAAQLSEAQGKGFVHVGVFPWGKVWIDKRFLGSAPKSVELEAGTHIIAGGIDKPLLSKSIEVKAGAEQQVVINLNKEEK
jgi:serine/threonine protein kinase